MTTRRERVVLELQDDFSGPAGRAAVAAALLNREVGNIGGSSRSASPEIDRSSRSVDGLGQSSRRTGPEIDRLSGRLGLLAKGLVAFGPAAIPISAAAIPAVTGLAEILGVTALAAGTTLLAFKGVGTALDALNKAQLDPTAAHLKAARLAMDDLSPAASDFVRALDQMQPAFDKLRQSAGKDMFPGLVVGLRGAETRLPQVRQLLEAVGGAVGNLGEMTGESLNSGKWDEFLTFLKTEAPPAIESLGRTIGSLTSGLAELWMAFAPLNGDVIGWLEDASQAFEEWSTGLSKTQGFADFVAYMQASGPEVSEALGAIGNAVLQVVQAFAPLGGPVLTVLTSVADLISTIADSPLGTPLAAIATAVSMLSLLNKGLTSAQGLMSGLTASGGAGGAGGGEGIGAFFQENADQVREAAGSMRTSLQGVGTTLRSSLGAGLAPTSGQMLSLRTRMGEVGAAGRQMAGAVGRAALPVAALGALSSGAAGNLGLTNTATLALAGSMLGGPGAAIGAGAGLLLDLKAAGLSAGEAIRGLNDAAAAGDLDVLNQKLAETKAQLADYNNTDFTSVGDVAQRIGSDLTNVFSGRFTDQGDEIQQTISKTSAEQEKLAASAQVAASAQAALSSYVSGSNVALFAQTQSIESAVESMRTMRSEALKAANAQLGYKGAILDARDALKANGKTLDLNTRGGIANKQALLGLADAWNGQSDAAKNAKGALSSARANFVNTAQAMGMSEDAAKRLAKRLFEIRSKNVSVIVNLTDAEQKIASIKSQLASIKGKSVYVGIRGPGASGMGPQFASGGYTGDGGKWDPAGIVHRGEVVIPQDRVKADWSMLKARYGDLPGFADGGVAGATTDTKKPKAKPKPRPAFVVDRDDPLFNAPQGLKARVGFLKEFEHDAKRALARLQRSSDAASASVDASKEAVDRETSARDQLQGSFDSLQSLIAGMFQSDLFTSTNDVFGSNSATSDPISVLLSDLANSQQFDALFAGLQGQGLHGSALTAAAQGGISGLQTVGAYNSTDLSRYQSLYDQREQRSASSGQQVAQAQFGQALADQTARLDEANRIAYQNNAQLVSIEAAVRQQEKTVKQAGAAQEAATKGLGKSVAAGKRNRR